MRLTFRGEQLAFSRVQGRAETHRFKINPNASPRQLDWTLPLIVGDPKGIYRLEKDRKSTRLNSSHVEISYAVFCLKKKKLKCSTRGRKSLAPPLREGWRWLIHRHLPTIFRGCFRSLACTGSRLGQRSIAHSGLCRL